MYCIVSARQAYCYVAVKSEKVSAEERGEVSADKRGKGEKYERSEAGNHGCSR